MRQTVLIESYFQKIYIKKKNKIMSYAVNFEQCPEFSISEYIEDDYEYLKLNIMGIKNR